MLRKHKRESKWEIHPALMVILGIIIIVVSILYILPNPLSALVLAIKATLVPIEIECYNDDQRSTLWPLLVSTAVAMLGSLITSYIFLKDALDRMTDEKPYYKRVIQEYREWIVDRLWKYTCSAVAIIVSVIILYFLLYYTYWRSRDIVRAILILLCVCISAGWSIRILRDCLCINESLYKITQELLVKNQKKMKTVKDRVTELLSNLGEIDNLEKIDKQTISNLQIGEEHIDCEKYINRFTDWEKLLLLLIEQETSPFQALRGQSQVKRIQIAMQKQEKVSDENIENLDAEGNGWKNGPYCEIVQKEAAFKDCDFKIDEFSQIFELLLECRNFLMVQMETKPQNHTAFMLQDVAIAELFTCMLLYTSIKIFPALPRIQVFIPAELFWYANFYNTRFENSAFRAALFQYSVFARSKIANTNFNTAKFEKCEFFSADCRDCSFSNTFMKECGFSDATFVFVDFTGSTLEKCVLERTKFQDSVLLNMELKDVEFKEGLDFTNSKLSNITITSKDHHLNFLRCNFNNCSIHSIYYDPKNPYQVHLREQNDMEKAVAVCLQFVFCERVKKCFWGADNDLSSSFADLAGNFEPVNPERKNVSALQSVDSCLTQYSAEIWNTLECLAVVHMKESSFENVEMPQFRFYRSDLSQCNFRDASMNEVWMVAVILKGAILTNVNLRNSILCATDMSSCVLSNAILFQADCRLVNFEDASLIQLHASKAKFLCCSFERSDCTQIDLTQSRLKQCSFTDTILSQAELTGARFEKTSFVNSIADKMLSSYSCYQDCDLTNALLSQSSLNNSTFLNCCFELANFRDSTIVNARFLHCNFKNSNFSRTCFINAYFEDSIGLSAECFIEAKFIQPRFIGEDVKFKEELQEQGVEIMD